MKVIKKAMKEYKSNAFFNKDPIWIESAKSSIFFKFIDSFTEFCCKYLPKTIRKKIFKFIDNSTLIFSRFINIINQIMLPAYIIKGREKYSREKINILYIGKDPFDGYISNLIFCDKTSDKKISYVFIWNIKKYLGKKNKNIDAVLIKNDIFYSRFFERQEFIIIPEWIGMTIDLTRSFEEIYSNFSPKIREDINKVKRYRYTYEISQDSEKLDLFYNKMYLPFIKKRYKENAKCIILPVMKHFLERGYELMLTKIDGEYASGLLFNIENNLLTLKYTGIMDGKMHLRKKGLGATTIYFSLMLAKKKNATSCNFGVCKPFLNDGLYRYKIKWNPRINKARKLYYYNTFSLKICKNSKSIQQFLKNNPFIFLKDDKPQIMNIKN